MVSALSAAYVFCGERMRTQHHAVQADGSATTMVIARAARDLRDGDSLLRFEPAPDQWDWGYGNISVNHQDYREL